MIWFFPTLESLFSHTKLLLLRYFTNREMSSHSFFTTLKNILQEVVYLQEKCSVLESQIEQHIDNEESYESQVNEFIKSVADLQNQLAATNTEKVSLMSNNFPIVFCVGYC